MNTEFAAVGSLRLRIINQIVGNIVDIKLNFSDVLRLQIMSLAQFLNGVKSGMSMLAAGVGLEGVDVDFQFISAHVFGKFFKMRFFDHGTAEALFAFQNFAGGSKALLRQISAEDAAVGSLACVQRLAHGTFF